MQAARRVGVELMPWCPEAHEPLWGVRYVARPRSRDGWRVRGRLQKRPACLLTPASRPRPPSPVYTKPPSKDPESHTNPSTTHKRWSGMRPNSSRTPQASPSLRRTRPSPSLHPGHHRAAAHLLVDLQAGQVCGKSSPGNGVGERVQESRGEVGRRDLGGERVKRYNASAARHAHSPGGSRRNSSPTQRSRFGGGAAVGRLARGCALEGLRARGGATPSPATLARRLGRAPHRPKPTTPTARRRGRPPHDEAAVQ